jgi:hypothetical protein
MSNEQRNGAKGKAKPVPPKPPAPPPQPPKNTNS